MESQAVTRHTRCSIQHTRKGSIKIIIRIRKIGLKDFKNVENGTISLPCADRELDGNMESEIIGIYGQNGSGKTAVVEAMHMLRLILSGNPLPENSGDYIHQAAESAELSFEIDVQLHQETCAVYYQA